MGSKTRRRARRGIASLDRDPLRSATRVLPHTLCSRQRGVGMVCNRPKRDTPVPVARIALPSRAPRMQAPGRTRRGCDAASAGGDLPGQAFLRHCSGRVRTTASAATRRETTPHRLQRAAPAFRAAPATHPAQPLSAKVRRSRALGTFHRPTCRPAGSGVGASAADRSETARVTQLLEGSRRPISLCSSAWRRRSSGKCHINATTPSLIATGSRP